LKRVVLGGIMLDNVDAHVSKGGVLTESLLGMSFLTRLRSYEVSGDYMTLRE
jgi:aspartyl protease family protein